MAVIIAFPTARRDRERQPDALVQGNTVLAFPGADRAPVQPDPEPARQARKRGESSYDDQRKSMLAKVHIAKKQLMETLPGFTDDVYRAVLEVNFGESTAANLEKWQLHNLLLHFEKLGFQAKKGRHRKQAPKALENDDTGLSREALLEKIEAQLTEKGRAEGTDVPWGYAVGILKRQTAKDPEGQVKSLDKASRPQLYALIAALYRDAKRNGRRVR